jgi:hypothetical protein
VHPRKNKCLIFFTITVAGILFYVGFVQTFWGNDPYLGWGITVIAALVFAEPAGYIMARLKLSGQALRSSAWRHFGRRFVDFFGCGRALGQNAVDAGAPADATHHRVLVDAPFEPSVLKLAVFELRNNGFTVCSAANAYDLNSVKELSRP